MQTSPCRAGQGGNLGQEEERGAGEGSWLSPGTVAAAGATGWEPGERSPLLRANTGREGGLCPPPRRRGPGVAGSCAHGPVTEQEQPAQAG